MNRVFVFAVVLTFIFVATGCGGRGVAMGKVAVGDDLILADATADQVVVARRAVPASSPAFDMEGVGFGAFGAMGAFGPAVDERVTGTRVVERIASAAVPVSPLAQNRLLTKDGGLWLRVPNIDRAQQEAVLIIESEGGLIFKSQIGSLEARVPPERFEDTMDRLAALGLVAQRWTNIQDVTEEVADLDLRLGVAREAHGRLTDLMAKADKVEDMLAVERELRRLTEEIERMEGQRRGITRRVESSTIKLTIEQLAEVANQPRDTQAFPWITDTGINAARTQAGSRWLGDTGWLARALIGRPFELGGVERGRLPEGLVPIQSDARMILGTTPEDHRLRVRLVEPQQEAGIDFWSAALRRSLENVRGYEVLSAGDATITDSAISGSRLETRVRFEGELWRYNVWIARKDDPRKLVVIEAAWREAEPNTLEAKAVEAVKGLRMR